MAQEAIGRSQGGGTSKIHAAVDEHGRALRLAISGGQVHDSQTMDAFPDWGTPPFAIVADKACGSVEIRKTDRQCPCAVCGSFKKQCAKANPT